MKVDELMDVDGAAEERGVNSETIRRWARFYGLRYLKKGNAYRFRRADLESFIPPSERLYDPQEQS